MCHRFTNTKLKGSNANSVKNLRIITHTYKLPLFVESHQRGDSLMGMLLVGFWFVCLSWFWIPEYCLHEAELPLQLLVRWQSRSISTTWKFIVFNKLSYITTKINMIQSDPDLIYSCAAILTVERDIKPSSLTFKVFLMNIITLTEDQRPCNTEKNMPRTLSCNKQSSEK